MHSRLFLARASTAQVALKAKKNHEYVMQEWLFLAAVIILLSAINWSRWLWRHFTTHRRTEMPAAASEKSAEPITPGASGKMAFRHTPAALASIFRVLSFRTTVPIGPSSVASVSELAFIVGYVIALLVWLFVDTSDIESFFIIDRASTLGSSQIPLIVALAGKNNIVSFLTGVSHEKLNVLHRAAARACLVLLWIHAIVRIVSGIPDKFSFEHGFMRCGIAGLVAFTMAGFLSIRIIRRSAFELFLVGHIVLVGTFLICGTIHTRAFDYANYVWPGLLLWGLDRGLRGLGILWNNRVWSRNDSHSRVATVEQLTDDTVRLTLRRRMKWKPGQHAYVILPSVSTLPFEAHPFSISSIPHSLDGTENTAENDIVFLIRGRRGFTRRLLEYSGSKTASPTVTALIDGPYGSPPDLSRFSTCVFFAGGSGVSYTLPLFLDLIRRAREGTTSVNRMVFVWIIRGPEHINWISRVLTAAVISAPSSVEIDMRIHITGKSSALPQLVQKLEYESVNGPENSSRPSSDSGESKKSDVMIPYSGLKTIAGRPNVHHILDEAVCHASGPVSVDVAGPSPLAQSIRTALSSEITSSFDIMTGRQPVMLHVETFGMVKG